MHPRRVRTFQHVLSLISPSSCACLQPISIPLQERPNGECEAKQTRTRKEMSMSSFLYKLLPLVFNSWLAKRLAVLSGAFRGLDLPKYEVLRAAIQPWLEGLAIMGNFVNFFTLIFPPFSATIECTPMLLIPAAILCRQSPVPALRSKMPPTSLCAWPRLLN
jgi:hypothetical protein